MNRQQSLIHIVAPNPDGRKKQMLIATCAHPSDVQDKVAQLGLDIDSIHVFAGFELPVLKQTHVVLGDPRPRRGRPTGSKNKKPRAKAAAKNELASRIKRKPAKRATSAEIADVPAKRGKRSGETQADRNARLEVNG